METVEVRDMAYEVRTSKVEIKTIALPAEMKKTQPAFDIILKLNGKRMDELLGTTAKWRFWPIGLHESIQQGYAGRYEMFTCDCGDAECDGWRKGILVGAEKGKVVWSMDKEAWNRPERFRLIFDKEAYEKLDSIIHKELKSLRKKHGFIVLDRGLQTPLDAILEAYKKMAKRQGIDAPNRKI